LRVIEGPESGGNIFPKVYPIFVGILDIFMALSS
jgi:hypothetical protein